MVKREFTFDELWNRLPFDIRNACALSMQDPVKHPEGSVETHTRQVFEYASRVFDNDSDLLLSAIFHDLGKPETQKIMERDGVIKISNIGHEHRCEYYINKYFDLYSDMGANKSKVVEICKNHMKAHYYRSGAMKKPNKRKMFEGLTYFNDILKFVECDTAGKKTHHVKEVPPPKKNEILLLFLEHCSLFLRII